jgi:hypothetical protein
VTILQEISEAYSSVTIPKQIPVPAIAKHLTEISTGQKDLIKKEEHYQLTSNQRIFRVKTLKKV